MSELRDEKIFYERFRALHEDAALLSICERFGIGAFRRSCVLEGFDEALRAWGLRGQHCVEIGTCKGLTAVVLARYFDAVTSIDVVPDEDRERIADYVRARNVTFVTVANNAEKAEALRGLTFDAAFVDGDHARDTRSDFALVERCGRVLFHEHWAPQRPVLELVESLRARGRVRTQGKFALWTA